MMLRPPISILRVKEVPDFNGKDAYCRRFSVQTTDSIKAISAVRRAIREDPKSLERAGIRYWTPNYSDSTVVDVFYRRPWQPDFQI